MRVIHLSNSTEYVIFQPMGMNFGAGTNMMGMGMFGDVESMVRKAFYIVNS